MLDIGSRRIVGFAVGEHHDADLAEAALQMAVAVRGGRAAVTGVIMHTDQGSEYTAGRVWAFAHVLPGARIGHDCNICDGAYVEGGAVTLAATAQTAPRPTACASDGATGSLPSWSGPSSSRPRGRPR